MAVTDALRFPDPPISLSGFHLRPWATDDVSDLVAAWRDPEMHRWMPEEANPFEAQQAGAFIEDAAKHLTDGTSVSLAIADGTSDQAVGSVTLHVWGPGHWNVGYWVATSHRNRGLATEGLINLSRWAFSTYPALARLSLYTLPGTNLRRRLPSAPASSRKVSSAVGPR